MVLILLTLLAFCACVTTQEEGRIGASAAGTGGEAAVEQTGPHTGTAVKPENAVPEASAGRRYSLDSVSSYLSNGVLDTVTTMVYENGRLVAEQTSFPDGSPAGLVSYSYSGNLVSSSVKKDRFGQVVWAHAYAYDKSGNLVQEDFLDANGKAIFSHRYSYDSQDRRKALEILSSDGLVLGRAEYLYANGRNDRVEIYGAPGEMQEYLVREFDEAGRPVLEVVSEMDGTEIEKVKFVYFDGMLVSKETYVQTKKTGSVEYRYDKAGNMIARVRHDRTGQAIEINEYGYIEVEK